MTTQITHYEIDDFGRDNSLRNQIAANLFMTELRKKFMNKSWAEIYYEEEEEEEEEERQLEEKRTKYLKEQTEIRKTLLLEGMYELEEGEI